MDPGRIRAKNKNFTRNPEKACKSSWKPERENQKSFYTDNSLEFGKACEDLSWKTLHVYTTQIGGLMVLLKEQCARVKRRYLCCVCLQSGSKWKVGGQIPWNGIPICENIQDLLSDGKKLHTRGRFWGNHLKGPIIPFGSLVEYHPITAKDQSRIHQFGKKSLTWIVPRIRLCTRVEFGRVDILIADLEELENDGTHRENLLEKTPQGEFIFSNRRWTNQKPLEEIRELRNIHLGTAATQFKERVILDFLGESEGSLFHNLKTRFRMPVKR